jgi:RimJ/RimL family protein N-acetyltransferase
MLMDSPRAFSADPLTGQGSDPKQVSDRLAQAGYAIVGAFTDERLVGAAGMVRDARRKLHHRVLIWGVWVEPDSRGAGVGEKIMSKAIEVARAWEGVQNLYLSACAAQAAAIRLYERVGFVAWGREPEMMIVDGEVYDEVHMQLRLGRR